MNKVYERVKVIDWEGKYFVLVENERNSVVYHKGFNDIHEAEEHASYLKSAYLKIDENRRRYVKRNDNSDHIIPIESLLLSQIRIGNPIVGVRNGENRVAAKRFRSIYDIGTAVETGVSHAVAMMKDTSDRIPARKKGVHKSKRFKKHKK